MLSNGNSEDKLSVFDQATTVRLPSDKNTFENKISIYQHSGNSTLPKRSVRMNLKPQQKEKLLEQTKLVKTLEEAIDQRPSGLEMWHIQNDDGLTLLHQAAYQNKPVVVRKLLKLANKRIDEVASLKGKDIIR